MPFAGGSKHSYRELSKLAPPNMKVHAIEIPGRGSRTNEPLLESCQALVEDVFLQIKDKLDQPYAIYGHSMGTLLGYLLTQKIREENRRQPLHLFLSSGLGPSIFHTKPRYHVMGKKEFIQKLGNLGGIPPEVLQNEILLNFFEPIFRADFKAIETYQYVKSTPFNIPITVMIGSEERISREQAQTWQKETIHPIELLEFPGGHFFINDYFFQIMDLISTRLDNQLSDSCETCSCQCGGEICRPTSTKGIMPA